MEIIGASDVTEVPYGTVIETVCAAWSIVPVAAGLVKLNAVRAFAGFGATTTVTT
jgi:uncharacterized membrane protein